MVSRKVVLIGRWGSEGVGLIGRWGSEWGGINREVGFRRGWD